MILKFYHNPRCSKSRQTLALLFDHGHAPDVIEYMKDGVDTETLKDLIGRLGFSSARDLMRTKEKQYRELGLKDESRESALIEAMSDYPRLMERPILDNGTRAAIGRPPENVLDIV